MSLSRIPLSMPTTYAMRCHWVFTINTPGTADYRALSTIVQDKRFKYMVYQLEKGESETLHIQGYVEFTRSIRFGIVKRLLGNRAHIEPRRGSRSKARDYCMKESTRAAPPVIVTGKPYT